MTLFLTFTTYGTHLPGDARGSFEHVRQGGAGRFRQIQDWSGIAGR